MLRALAPRGVALRRSPQAPTPRARPGRRTAGDGRAAGVGVPVRGAASPQRRARGAVGSPACATVARGASCVTRARSSCVGRRAAAAGAGALMARRSRMVCCLGFLAAPPRTCRRAAAPCTFLMRTGFRAVLVALVVSRPRSSPAAAQTVPGLHRARSSSSIERLGDEPLAPHGPGGDRARRPEVLRRRRRLLHRHEDQHRGQRQRRLRVEGEPHRGRPAGVQHQDEAPARSTTPRARCRSTTKVERSMFGTQEPDAYFYGETIEKIGRDEVPDQQGRLHDVRAADAAVGDHDQQRHADGRRVRHPQERRAAT